MICMVHMPEAKISVSIFMQDSGIASFDLGFFYGRSCKKIGSLISFDTDMSFYLDEFQINEF